MRGKTLKNAIIVMMLITASPELKKMFCCQFQSFFRPKVLAQIEIEFLAWSRWKMEPAMKKSLSSRFLAPFLAASKGDSFRELKEVQILFFWKYEKAFSPCDRSQEKGLWFLFSGALFHPTSGFFVESASFLQFAINFQFQLLRIWSYVAFKKYNSFLLWH